MASLVEVLKADPEYKKFRRIFKTISGRLKLERDRKEVTDMHSSREIHSLYGKAQYNPNKLYSAQMNDARNRARMTKIRQSIEEQYDLLHRATKAFRQYALAYYKDELKPYSNQQQRMAVIERVMVKALDLESECENVIKHIDRYIQDLDQASYTYSNTTKILELLLNNKGKTI
ncbi:hypothetical protein [Achromobacter phage Motura]|uniref:Uncharacterized protein n=1 Tax=Achromobacter phage Motura TaxID=2591403 RepID=A0A514CSG3_9CAUD|nr:hypothetical protein H1O15_gp005 [Achromobacter phage Motura]QDH83414.1 hypothetical protein [Achromobacter phage Motura]